MVKYKYDKVVGKYPARGKAPKTKHYKLKNVGVIKGKDDQVLSLF